MSVALILLSFYDDAKIDAKGNRECEIRFFAYSFRTYSFNFVSKRLVETGFKKTRTRTRGIKTKLRTKEMRRDRDNKLSIFIEFGRNCPLPPLPVLSVSLRPIIIHGSDFCSLYTYNSHPFWESLATETWEKEERLKKKKKEEGKGNGTFRSSRDHVFHTLSSHDLSASLFFFFFQFYSSSSNEKLTGSLPFYVRWGERERMFPREKQPEARAPPSLDIAIQPRWPRILVFHSSSRFHAHMDSLFVHGSCQFVAWKNASIVSRSRRTLDGWLGNHRTSNRWMLRKVGDLFERSSFEYVFPRFINDLNNRIQIKKTWRF